VCTATAKLESDTGTRWQITTSPDFGTTASLRPIGDPGVTLAPNANPQDAAMAFLTSYAGVLTMTAPSTELVLEQGSRDSATGTAYAGYHQAVNGVPVLGSRVAVLYDPTGRLSSVASNYVKNIAGMSTTPKIDPAGAAASAQADMITKSPANTLGAVIPMAPSQLFLVPNRTGGATLEYEVFVTFALKSDSTRHVDRTYFVDANTGAALSSADSNRYQYHGPGASVGGTGQGSIEQFRHSTTTRAFPVFSANPPSGPPFYMQDLMATGATRRFVLIQYAGSKYQMEASNVLSSWDTSGPSPGVAVDAYTYLGDTVVGWWKEKGRNSYDNNNSGIVIVAYDPALADNAAWNRNDKRFHIGPSSPTLFPMSASLDVLAHEFQHAVNDSVFQLLAITTRLLYPDSGGLDESFGDVFGQFIEIDRPPSTYTPDPSFEGEGSYTKIGSGGFLRSLKEPHAEGEPDNLQDPLYDATTDVHAWAGVPNNAWYIATYGGTNSYSGFGVDNTSALMPQESEQLYSQIFQNPQPLSGFTKGAMYQSLANALIANARAIYGRSSVEVTTLACAWFAVGVLAWSDLQAIGIDFSTQCTSGPVTRPVIQGKRGCGGGLEQCPATPCETAPAGTNCSTDDTLLYTCDGNGASTAAERCANGCRGGDSGLDVCIGGVLGVGNLSSPCVGLVQGYYCGGNGTGSANVLYSCDGQGNVTASASCDFGCVQNVGTPVSAVGGSPPPGCSGSGFVSCFGIPQGTYCGNDLVCGDPQSLYQCDANGNITLLQTCPAACAIVSSGSQAGGADSCLLSSSNAQAGADTCARDVRTPVVTGPGSSDAGTGNNGNNNCPPGQRCLVALPTPGSTPYPCRDLPAGLDCMGGQQLYDCRGLFGLPDRHECTCQGSSTGSDSCVGPCANLPDGPACASDGVTLLQCQATDVVAQQTCPNGCQGNHTGQDICTGLCTNRADGLDCSSDGSALLECLGGSVLGQQTCPSGCTQGPPGDDSCTTACTSLPDGTDCSTDGTTLLQCQGGVVAGQSTCPGGCTGTRQGADSCAATSSPCGALPGGNGELCDSSGASLLQCTNGAVTSTLACAHGCHTVGGGSDFCDGPGLCASLPNQIGFVCDSTGGTAPGTILAQCAGGNVIREQACPNCQAVGNGNDFCPECTLRKDGTYCASNGIALTTCQGGAVAGVTQCPGSGTTCPGQQSGHDACASCSGKPDGPNCAADGQTLLQCVLGGVHSEQLCAGSCVDGQCVSPGVCQGLKDGFYCQSDRDTLIDCVGGVAIGVETCSKVTHGLCQPYGPGSASCYEGTPTPCTGNPDGEYCAADGKTLLKCNVGRVLGTTLCPFGCRIEGNGFDYCPCGPVAFGQGICGGPNATGDAFDCVYQKQCDATTCWLFLGLDDLSGCPNGGGQCVLDAQSHGLCAPGGGPTPPPCAGLPDGFDCASNDPYTLMNCKGGLMFEEISCQFGCVEQQTGSAYCGGVCANLPDGTDCETDGFTLAQCKGGAEIGQQTCVNGCVGKQTGKDVCAAPPPPPPPCTNMPNGSDCAPDGRTLLQCQQGSLAGEQMCPSGCISTGVGTDRCTTTVCTGLSDGYTCDPADATQHTLLSCYGQQPNGGEIACLYGCQTVGGGQDHCKPGQNSSDPCANLPQGSGFVCDNGLTTLQQCSSDAVVWTQKCPSTCQPVGGGGDYCPGYSGTCNGNSQAPGVFCYERSVDWCSNGQTQREEACPNGCVSVGLGNDSCAPPCPIANGTVCVANTIETCSGGSLSSEARCLDGCQTTASGPPQCFSVVGTAGSCASLPGGTGFACNPGLGALEQCSNGTVIAEGACGSYGCVTANGSSYCNMPPGGAFCQPNGANAPNGTNCIGGAEIAWCFNGHLQNTQNCAKGCTAGHAGADACNP
jgi:Zn-dependent metalloprotease